MARPSSGPPSLGDHLAILGRRRGIILLTVILAVGASIALSVSAEERYTATSQIEFQDAAESLRGLGSPIAQEFQPEKRAAAGAQTVTNGDIVTSVIEDLGLTATIDDVREDVSAFVEPDSNLVTIEAEASTARGAARLANAFARETSRIRGREERARFEDAARRLRGELSRLTRVERDGPTGQAYRDAISRLLALGPLAEPVKFTRIAAVPTSPSSPKPVRNAVIALLLGVFFGVGLAYLRHSLDRRYASSTAVEEDLGGPLLGVVRDNSLGFSGRNAPDAPLTEEELEAFRIIRANYVFLADGGAPKTVVVTSALPEEGKSTVAAGLAHASALAGQRTLLVECDFRRPVLADRLGLDATPGLSEYIAGEAEPGDVVRATAVDERAPDAIPLAVIVAGRHGARPTEAISSPRFAEFLAAVREPYDLVVLDSPPLLPVGDTIALIPQADAVVLCVRVGKTTSVQGRQARAAIDRLPSRPVGLVATGVTARSRDEEYYGYYAADDAVRA